MTFKCLNCGEPIESLEANFCKVVCILEWKDTGRPIPRPRGFIICWLCAKEISPEDGLFCEGGCSHLAKKSGDYQRKRRKGEPVPPELEHDYALYCKARKKFKEIYGQKRRPKIGKTLEEIRAEEMLAEAF